ncbi:TetR/AcrR family transcriptional regulator [Reyranella sp.]|uniref:TetR/AcrR family transcriptional regulator n=1 Tax=Reyranella sp. TaxID=1929291 RepID=UPI00272F9348|nr:TetR/AcrR family transcriptional regulator [Reyranella sp.]MDP2372551.1 TetR/AcrR family transcriptional regulator [Reyranella sp.]
MTPQALPPSRQKILEAATDVVRAKGYAATTVDDLCAAAGVTKGSFFHHFKSKEEMVLQAVAHWGSWTDGIFAAAPYASAADPRARVFGYLDFRRELLDHEVPQFTCLMGTLVQETYETHPAVRAACDRGMSSHVAFLTRDIEAARLKYAPDAAWTAESVGYFIQAVLQGSFIFAKAKQDAAIARGNLAHLRRYLESLLGSPDQIPR